jgi:hypothetical protein
MGLRGIPRRGVQELWMLSVHEGETTTTLNRPSNDRRDGSDYPAETQVLPVSSSADNRDKSVRALADAPGSE